jgi:hypothetical protein
MRFMNLIMLFDFIQVLNILRKHPTKNEYFPMHIVCTTIYLLQEQELNPRIYSEQELIMSILYMLLIMILTCMERFNT